MELDGLDFDRDDEFAALLGLVEKSKLDSFCIGCIRSQAMCQLLIRTIPKIQVQTLKFRLSGDLLRRKADLIGAVKSNASLRTVAGTLHGTDFFDRVDKPKLNIYAARNAGIAQRIAPPNTVDRGAWANALAKAQETGPDTVFRILLAPGSFAIPVEGKRSRKRPRRYSPSW